LRRIGEKWGKETKKIKKGREIEGRKREN